MSDISYKEFKIENRIFTIRGVAVMLDSDIAKIYQVETRALNQAVKRNIERFPADFMFQLDDSESARLTKSIYKEEYHGLRKKHLISQNVISKGRGGRRKLPFVFTEQGVAGLSGVLKSQMAAMAHVAIMRAFIQMRKLTQSSNLINYRLNHIEQKQLEANQKIDQLFRMIENKEAIPVQGVFFEGQVFDAYVLSSKIIRSAKKSIVLIDNYIDENTLTHLTKKRKDIKVLLLTNKITDKLMLDVKKTNEQFSHFEIREFSKSHDRFLIIDDTDVYHLGASLKDLGKKWFAFSTINKKTVGEILDQI